ncbi:hypothetical protein BV25DRAFT_1843484 [Artomyces pyxidatus]|uniref:Uncharacterized protein n=1 Tax=Artomyces pyxidatus TaxID=48021 RepID=A0ACB8SFA1_9AGAM|nr:hypothetical protein BV25DRAFT_1843484 [Artomyces pyxidatus]
MLFQPPVEMQDDADKGAINPGLEHCEEQHLYPHNLGTVPGEGKQCMESWFPYFGKSRKRARKQEKGEEGEAVGEPEQMRVQCIEHVESTCCSTARVTAVPGDVGETSTEASVQVVEREGTAGGVKLAMTVSRGSGCCDRTLADGREMAPALVQWWGGNVLADEQCVWWIIQKLRERHGMGVMGMGTQRSLTWVAVGTTSVYLVIPTLSRGQGLGSWNAVEVFQAVSPYRRLFWVFCTFPERKP